MLSVGFPGGVVLKNRPASAEDTGDMGLIPRLGRSPGGENSNPLQYFCLENSMDIGARWSAWDCVELDTAEHTHTHSMPNTWSKIKWNKKEFSSC